MDPTLQRHAAKCIYIIPDGLKELLSDISREVLRMQPQNLYTFIADYLEALLLTRENARVAARLIQSVTEIAETTMEFLEKTGMHKSQVEKVVNIMDRQFKKKVFEERNALQLEQGEHIDEANMISNILSDAELEQDVLQESIAIIQRAYRKFKRRKEAEKILLTGMIDWRIAARSALKLYRQTGVTNEEAKRAATLIKAAYKGYYTRRIMMTLTEEQKILNPEITPYELSEHEPEALSREASNLTKGESKTVTIDYDTVIPHVDFGDVTDLESPSAIAAFILDKVLTMVVNNAPKDLKQKSKTSKRSSQVSERSRKSQISEKSVPSRKSERLSHVTDYNVISERKSTVSQRRSRASARVSYVEPMSDTYDEKSDAGSYISGHSSRISERSVRISEASRRSSRASQASHVSHGSHISHGSFVSGQSSHASRRSSNVSEHGNHVSERGSHVSERGSQVLSQRGSHVSERGSHVSERGSHVSERGSHVSERGSHVSERGSHVSERGSHVSGRGSNISRQSGKELPEDLLV